MNGLIFVDDRLEKNCIDNACDLQLGFLTFCNHHIDLSFEPIELFNKIDVIVKTYELVPKPIFL